MLHSRVAREAFALPHPRDRYDQKQMRRLMMKTHEDVDRLKIRRKQVVKSYEMRESLHDVNGSFCLFGRDIKILDTNTGMAIIDSKGTGKSTYRFVVGIPRKTLLAPHVGFSIHRDGLRELW